MICTLMKWYREGVDPHVCAIQVETSFLAEHKEEWLVNASATLYMRKTGSLAKNDLAIILPLSGAA